jgi:NADH-quinone oxidoreductase subunit E
LSEVFNGRLGDELAALLTRYPDPRSATLPALHLAQRATGTLTEEVKDEVAQRLGVHPAFVESVATFYSLYLEDPPGRHIVHVCTTLSCMLAGADSTVDAFRDRLGVDIGGTDAQREFSLFTAECLGACQHAPVARIDGGFHFAMTSDRVDSLLAELRTKEPGSASPDLAPEVSAAMAAVERNG